MALWFPCPYFTPKKVSFIAQRSVGSFDLYVCDARKQNKPTWTNTPPEWSSTSAYSSTSLPALPRCPSFRLPSGDGTNNLLSVPHQKMKKRNRRHPTHSPSSL